MEIAEISAFTPKGRNSSSGRVGTEDAGARRRGSSLVLANPLALPSHQAASASTEALTELLARKTLARRVKAVPFVGQKKSARRRLASVGWSSKDCIWSATVRLPSGDWRRRARSSKNHFAHLV